MDNKTFQTLKAGDEVIVINNIQDYIADDLPSVLYVGTVGLIARDYKDNKANDIYVDFGNFFGYWDVQAKDIDFAPGDKSLYRVECQCDYCKRIQSRKEI